jgi:hypothetical protein
VVIVGEPGEPATAALLAAALRPFLPARLVAGSGPLADGKATVAGRPAAYLCRDRVCGLPITEPGQLRSELGS